ncbi:MAG TPA: hypothetical protein VNU26_10245 [Mycobacteriales bacterium]|nr:hypothetical protein [Mycobacteriales bacterium]
MSRAWASPSSREDAADGSGRPHDTGFARRYGARPWHLLVLLALFAATGYVASRLLGDPTLPSIVLWFVGAAVVWDLVLGPALSLGDLGLRTALRRRRPAGVRPLNYVRVPALLSLLLLVLWAPLVLQRSEAVYRAKTGLTQDPYLERWLAVTAVLFAASAVAFLAAVWRGRRRRPAAAPAAGPVAPPPGRAIDR